MDRFAELEIIRRQGLDSDSSQFVKYALKRLVESVALGMGCELEPDVEMESIYPSAAGLLWALNQPVNLSALIDDVAHALGVTALWSVRVALGEEGDGPISA